MLRELIVDYKSLSVWRLKMIYLPKQMNGNQTILVTSTAGTTLSTLNFHGDANEAPMRRQYKAQYSKCQKKAPKHEWY